MSECVPRTLAYQGLRVGSSKLLTYSSGVVQIRVGLELADSCREMRKGGEVCGS